MELRETKIKTKCDNGACKNMADYEVYRADTMASQRLRLCKRCLQSLSELAKQVKWDFKPPKVQNNIPKNNKNGTRNAVKE